MCHLSTQTFVVLSFICSQKHSKFNICILKTASTGYFNFNLASYCQSSDLQYKEELLFGDMNSVRKSSFRPNILTCFLTHGFLDDYKGLEAIKDGKTILQAH